jgi:hypothetical protein
MKLKPLISACVPFLGEVSTKAKLRELEQEAGSLPIIFGVMVGKSVESLVLWNWGKLFRFAGAAVAVAVIYLHERWLRQKASEAAEQAKDKAEDVVED